VIIKDIPAAELKKRVDDYSKKKKTKYVSIKEMDRNGFFPMEVNYRTLLRMVHTQNLVGHSVKVGKSSRYYVHVDVLKAYIEDVTGENIGAASPN